MSVTIYMDVDGVLGPFSDGGPRQNTGWDTWNRGRAAGLQMLWSPDLMAALKELEQREDVTFKWLTSWVDDAPEALGPLFGLGHDWPVLGTEYQATDDPSAPHWWKLQELQRDILATNPDKVVWLDDDIWADPDAMKFVNTTPNLLAIWPNRIHGLTQKHLAEIATFIEGG